MVIWTTILNVFIQHGAYKCKLALSESLRQDSVTEGPTVYHIEYFDTFGPMASSTTVRTQLVISVILGSDIKQVDYTCAFLHAPIAEDLYV